MIDQRVVKSLMKEANIKHWIPEGLEDGMERYTELVVLKCIENIEFSMDKGNWPTTDLKYYFGMEV